VKGRNVDKVEMSKVVVGEVELARLSISWFSYGCKRDPKIIPKTIKANAKRQQHKAKVTNQSILWL
jgi:hypothetical protein